MATQLLSLLILMSGNVEENRGPVGDGEGCGDGCGDGVVGVW